MKRTDALALASVFPKRATFRTIVLNIAFAAIAYTAAAFSIPAAYAQSDAATSNPIQHLTLGTEAQTVRIRNGGAFTSHAIIEYVSQNGSIIRTETSDGIRAGDWINFTVGPDLNAVGVTISGPEGLAVGLTPSASFDSTRHVLVAGLLDAFPAARALLLWNYSADPTTVALAAIDQGGAFTARSNIELASGQSLRVQLSIAFSDVDPAEVSAVQVTSQIAIAGLELPSTPIHSVIKSAGLRSLAISSPTDLQARIESSLRAIINGVPAPPTDWGTLISAQLSGKANQLFTYYLLGTETYSAAATQGSAALKYLSVGDLTNANAAYSRMLSLRYDGDVLFGAAAQSSIDAVDQVDSVVAAVRRWSFTGAGIVADVACLNPWCGRAIEALDASTQWAVTKSIDGTDAANHELYSTIFVKAILATPVDGTSLSKVADESVNHLVGDTAGKYYNTLANVVKSSAVRTNILKFAASVPRNLLSDKMEDGLKNIGDFAAASRTGTVTLPPPPPQAVSLQMSPTSASLVQGKSTQFNLTLIRQNFFAAFPLTALVKTGSGQGTWDAYRDVAPVGMSINFTPTSPLGSTAVMTISASASLAPGPYRFYVFGLGVNVTARGFFGTLVVTPGPTVPATPSLSSPGNGATGVSTASSVTWPAVSGATSYDVYFGTSSSPSLAGNISTNSFRPSSGLSAGMLYFWRVIAKNGTGSSPSSPTWSFTTQPAVPATPSLSSPGNGATGVSTASLVTWPAVSSATSYDVYFGTSSSPSLAGNISTNSFRPSSGLSAGTRYFWRVIAKNGAGSSPSSPTWSFTTQAAVPATPSLSSPGNGATGVSTASSVTWLAVSGATSYDIYFGTSSSPSLAGNISTNSFRPSSGLSAGTRYFWRVIAKNGAGSSPSSPTWSFTTQAAVPQITGYAWTAIPRNRQNFGGTIGGSGFVSGTLVWFCVAGSSTCYQQPTSLITVNNVSTLTVKNVNLTTGSWQVFVQTGAGQSARSASFNVKP